MEGDLRSDCRPLHELSAAALAAGEVHILRDPTRGGVATTLNEFVEGSGLCIDLEEEAIPVDEPVAAACDLLGLDPLYAACEGRMLAVVASGDAEAVLGALRALPGAKAPAASAPWAPGARARWCCTPLWAAAGSWASSPAPSCPASAEFASRRKRTLPRSVPSFLLSARKIPATSHAHTGCTYPDKEE